MGLGRILPISWSYVRLMGGEGLKRATQVAVLSANYIAKRLEPHFPVLYNGPGGLVAHECIIDLRPLTKATGVSVDDVAKRLIDYGFHAPTMSFPVAGTLMIEPTESEDLAELDRFCEAMIAIRAEIEKVGSGAWPADDNPLRGAPHTADALGGEWDHAYTREEAVFRPGCPPPTSTGRRCAASTSLRRPEPGLLLPAAGRVRGLSPAKKVREAPPGPAVSGRGLSASQAVASDTSVDLTSATTGVPTDSPRSSAACRVTAAVSSAPSTRPRPWPSRRRW